MAEGSAFPLPHGKVADTHTSVDGDFGVWL